MKRSIWLVFGAACFLTAALLFSASLRSRDEQLAAEIAPGILRFHILADNNRKEDQELKLKVRSLLLDQINAGIAGLKQAPSSPEKPSDSTPEESPDSGAGKAAVIRYIRENAPPPGKNRSDGRLFSHQILRRHPHALRRLPGRESHYRERKRPQLVVRPLPPALLRE